MVVIMVVVVVVVMIMAVLRSSDYAFDATDDAPGHSADDSAHCCADRTGGASAFRRASLATLDDALSPCRERHRQNGGNAKNASG
jgi:hypothetical protein